MEELHFTSSLLNARNIIFGLSNCFVPKIMVFFMKSGVSRNGLMMLPGWSIKKSD